MSSKLNKVIPNLNHKENIPPKQKQKTGLATKANPPPPVFVFVLQFTIWNIII